MFEYAQNAAKDGSYELEFEAIFRKLGWKQARVDVRAVIGGRVTPVIYKNVVELTRDQEAVLNNGEDEYSSRVLVTHFNLRSVRKMSNEKIPGAGFAFVKHWGKARSFSIEDLSEASMARAGDLKVYHIQEMVVSVKPGSDVSWFDNAVAQCQRVWNGDQSETQPVLSAVPDEEPAVSLIERPTRGYEGKRNLGEITLEVMHVSEDGSTLNVAVAARSQAYAGFGEKDFAGLHELGSWQVAVRPEHRKENGDISDGALDMLVIGVMSSMVRQSATGAELVNFQKMEDEEGYQCYTADVVVDRGEHPTSVAYAISLDDPGCSTVVPVEL